MTLVQKNIGNATYYTDDANYYTFHIVSSKDDALYKFACLDLGISIKPSFTAEESARINDLAGTGLQQKTKYLLLKNGQAVQVPYHNTGLADLHVGDVLLRQVGRPAAGLVKCPHCASLVSPGPVCSACGKQLTA